MPDLKKKKLLIITSSGGGGLIQTANAKEQEALTKDPHLVIVRKDLLKEWTPFPSFCTNFWNEAQQKGKLSAQMICVYGQPIVDFFFFPWRFYHALRTFFREEVDAIIDTQPMGTSAIIKALRIYNKARGKGVKVEKVIVDLPTTKATHFFRPIKKLSKKHRRLLSVTSVPPLLEEGETAEEFWQKTCGFSEKEINCGEVYVRQAFHQYKGKKRSEKAMAFKIGMKTAEELRLMRKAFERGPIRVEVREKEAEFHVEPESQMYTVLLGSQPAKTATLNYVKKIAQIAKENPDVITHVFAFCADHKEGEESLLKQVSDFATSLIDYPKNLSIIPFPFQNEQAIAPLFFRSDMTCTRSGGQTAMELMCVGTGEIWIHSEAKAGQDVLKGIPGWEAASALYLKKLKGAKIVTPDSCVPHLKALYQRDNRLKAASRFAQNQLESTA